MWWLRVDLNHRPQHCEGLKKGTTEKGDGFIFGANTVYARVCAIHGLEQIAARHPEMRARCVAVLHEVLEG